MTEPNSWHALDAAMSISLHFGRDWRRASEAERYGVTPDLSA